MLSTAESSGGTTSGGAYSARVQNKIQCSLDDITFGASLGEGTFYIVKIIYIPQVPLVMFVCVGLTEKFTKSTQLSA